MAQAALYARVSTRRQEQEATIESQLEQIRTCAQKQGHQIPATLQFIDQAVSGDTLMRPGLDHLRDEAAARTFDLLYCLSPDRLARNLGAQHVILSELRRMEVKVIFLSQPDLGDGPQAQLLLNIQGAFAEYERLVISERMRRGRLHRLRQGESLPYPAPYGYFYQSAQDGHANQWLVVEHEAQVVKQMFEWYTQEQMTFPQIAQRLNRQAVPSPQKKNWTQSTVRRLIAQPAYKGVAYYNRHQTDYQAIGQPRRQGRGYLRFPRYQLRTADEWIECTVPALVDEAIWQTAREQTAMNARFSPRNSRNRYLLRSLLVCAQCGYTLQGQKSRDMLYYRCMHGGTQRPEGVPGHTCSIRADVIEPLIWHALADLLHDPQRIQLAWQAICQQPTTAPDQLQRWQQRQKQLQHRRQRLLDAYTAGAISLSELTERQNPFLLELRQIKKNLAIAPPSAPIQIDLDSFIAQIQLALSVPDFETKQEVLRLLIDNIVVADDTLTVEHIVPTINSIRLEHTFSET